MFNVLSFFILALVPPVVDLPDAAEVCIITAELCIAHAEIDTCSEPTQDERKLCIEAYETCAQDIPELHDPYTCRIAHVWCVLEGSDTKDMVVFCEDVAAACGT
jgi:hypothetical protein